MREDLLDGLHLLGAVQITDLNAAAEADEEIRAVHHPFEPETRELRLALAKSDFIIELFERFEKPKGGLISSFLKERVHVTYEEYLAAEGEVGLDAVYRELEDLDIEHRQAEGAISELAEEIKAMRPWEALDCPLAAADVCVSVELKLAVAVPASLGPWAEGLEERCPGSAWEEMGREGDRAYVAVLLHADHREEFDALASEFDLEQVRFEGKTATVAEERRLAEERLAGEERNKEGLEDRIRERLPMKPRILTLNDYIHNQLLKEEVKGRLLHTRRVVALEGWVEQSREDEVREGLKRLGRSIDIDFAAPAEDEIAPTVMVNRRRIQPAENLINLFGIPNRSETDPTPFVAPFFILFFAMCIGDLGYGLVLAAAFWLAMKKLDVSLQAKSFFRLFFYCGLVTVVVGVFTRGYFGIDGDLLPGFLKFPGTMDIIKDPKPLMLICAALGLIHISVGVAIEMYDNMRENSVWLGFCEQGTTLLLWFGLAVLAAGFWLIKVDAVGWAGVYILAAGAAGIVFLSNISSKSIAGKFFGGLFNLYGLFGGTIGDVASYLRLYALGLATVAIGYVVNLMAGMVFGVPVLGIVLTLAVLLGGHAFNLLINFLGAFVHPLRLQYVEFFGKFYEDGGETFDPLSLQTRRTVIDG